MDATLAKLTKFATDLRYEDLPAEVVHQAERHIIDELGCAIGASMGAPGRASRELAAEYSSKHSSRVVGLKQRTTPDLAAFANAFMGRYLDFNDSYGATNLASGHPGDSVPGVLAMAEAYHRSGKDTILGIVAAYEANTGLQAHLKKQGWDSPLQSSIATPVGVGVALGLSAEVIANAISLSIVPSVPLRVARSGELSMWKGGAGPNATRNGVFATLIAMKGITGPGEPFEGRNGLFEQATGPIEARLNPQKDGFTALANCNIKFFPAEGSCQQLLRALIDASRGLPEADIEAIETEVNWHLWFDGASEPAKWDPKTRETADHSLPYLMARGLRDGTITVDSFSDKAVADPTLRPLMNKIKVVENAEFTKNTPAALGMTQMTLVMKSGKRHVVRADGAGAWKKPTDAEVDQKFRAMAEVHASPEACGGVLKDFWSLAEAKDLSPLMDRWADLVTVM